MSAGGSEPMTLFLSISAVCRLSDPDSAIAEAKTWSEHVGIVGDAMEPIDDVRSFVDDLGANPDLVAGQMSGSLADVRQRLRTERHVLVGSSERQRAIANALGWEYEDIADAAAAAEWDLEEQ